MRTSVFRFPLDVNQSQSQASIVAGVHEDGIRLIMRLVENGAPFDIHHAARAEFSAVLPGSAPVMNPCMIFGQGTVVYDFTGAEVQEAGVVPCQLFLYNPDGSLILSPKFTLVVHENAAAGGEEVAAQKEYETLKKFVREISNVQNVLGTLHEEIYGDLDPNCKYDKDFPYDPDYKINNFRSRIDVLEAARPVTGSFSVGDAMWGKSDDGYTATIELTANPLRSGDVMLILPDGEDTRKASADVVVSVKSAENGAEADSIVLTAKSKPTETTLWYRYVVIKRGVDDTTLLPVASIVGVHDVPTYVTDWIDRADQATASNEQKIDNEVERLDGEVERLDERIDNLPQSSGGISVGRGEFTIPLGDWEDDYPDRAKVVFPAETFVVGDVVVVTPANDETREAANSAGLFIRMAMSGDYDPHDDQIMLARATTGLKPTEDMRFVYAVLHTDSDANALVTLIGVDAAGGSEPTLVDLSRFEGEPDTESGLIKGYITEVFGEGEDAPKKVTEVVYDDAGNIIKIGNTAINWGEEA